MISRIAAALALLACASTLTAQLADVPNTGCSDGSTGGSRIFAQGGQSPTLGNLTFALEHICPDGANAAFFVFAPCRSTLPLTDWNLLDPCFGSWLSTPPTCGKAFDVPYFLDGDFTRQGKVVWSFPIPNIPALQTLSQQTPFCFQFVCVNLNAANPCIEISAGLSLTIQ